MWRFGIRFSRHGGVGCRLDLMLLEVFSNLWFYDWGRTSSLWGWQSTGTGCPGRLWSLLLWRYSRPAWTRSCAGCCRWPCFSRGAGLDDPQRALPTPNILWFCDLWFYDCPGRRGNGRLRWRQEGFWDQEGTSSPEPARCFQRCPSHAQRGQSRSCSLPTPSLLRRYSKRCLQVVQLPRERRFRSVGRFFGVGWSHARGTVTDSCCFHGRIDKRTSSPAKCLPASW